jgi:AraC-like DNA-binding protein
MTETGQLHSTSRGNILALSQAIRSYGIDPEPILLEGNIDLASLNDTTRVSGQSMDFMICLAVETTGDPAFGLRFADYIQPTSYHALGVALLYSPTLRSFCIRLARYFAIVTTMDDTRFEEENGNACLSTHPLFEYSETMHRCHPDAWAAWIVKLLRLICNPGFNPVSVTLTWTPPEHLQGRYDQTFQCPITYSGEVPRIYLDASTLDDPLPTSNAELARQNDQVITEFLAGIDKSDLPTMVRMKMIEYLPSGECDRERVAQSLNMTVRTLHNHLEGAGTSYQQLLDEIRLQLAQEYIDENKVSVSEIAYLLGYTDLSSFSRAFKRWTGMAPRDFANRQEKATR